MLEPVQSREECGDRQRYRGAGTDLYIWRETDGSIRGFQFCWTEAGDEYCVTGIGKHSVWLHRVDGGEARPWHNRAPVLRAAASTHSPLNRFRATSAGLDPATGSFLLQQLSTVA
jgi:hypothetical protein